MVEDGSVSPQHSLECLIHKIPKMPVSGIFLSVLSSPFFQMPVGADRPEDRSGKLLEIIV